MFGASSSSFPYFTTISKKNLLCKKASTNGRVWSVQFFIGSTLHPAWHFALSRPLQRFVLSPLLKGRGPEACFADLRLALGIAIFSKSTAHGHFLEDFASKLFNLFNNVPDVPYNAQFLYAPLSWHHEPALEALLRNCKTKGCSQKASTKSTDRSRAVPGNLYTEEQLHLQFLAYAALS